MSRRRAGSALLAALVLFPGVASAHDISATRFDSPIPLPFLLLGAGVTVAATAGWLGWAGSPSAGRWSRRLWTVPEPLGRAVRWGAVAAFSVAVAVAVAAGLVGPRASAENLAAVFVWGVWFKGLALFAMALGSPWAALSPWRNLYRLLAHLEGERFSLGSYPDRLGVWPAFVGFVLVVGVGENVLALSLRPRLTAGVVAAFALLMVLGGLLAGPQWFRDGDAFAVLYRLFGRVSPVRLERTAEGHEVRLRAPWRACTRPVTRPGMVAFVVSAVYTVSFDGFTSTPEYQTLLFRVRDALGPGPTAVLLLYLAGLALFVLSFLGVSRLADAVAGAGPYPGSAARAFAPTVIPIAAAYEFAHYYPYVARNASRLLELLAGAGGVDVRISLLGWLGLPAFWGSQVLLVVAGHLVAVVAAHGVADGRFESLARARRGHLPLVVLMVGYTVLSLWIISRPVVS